MVAKKQTESAVQRALVRWIKDTYPLVKVQATLNENSRTKMDMGCDVGITDLLLFAKKETVLHVFFLELKTKKGTLSKPQQEWAKDYYSNFDSVNSHYRVAYGFTEAKEAIEEWITYWNF